MHMLGPRSVRSPSEAPGDTRAAELERLASEKNLPLAFPMARWLSFDVEERSRFNRAQLVLDAMEATAPNSVGALARDTGLEHQDLGEPCSRTWRWWSSLMMTGASYRCRWWPLRKNTSVFAFRMAESAGSSSRDQWSSRISVAKS
jgi:hypothetical protein